MSVASMCFLDLRKVIDSGWDVESRWCMSTQRESI